MHEWEVRRATYSLDRNILKLLNTNPLWKWTHDRKDENRLNVVTLQNPRMGSLMRATS